MDKYKDNRFIILDGQSDTIIRPTEKGISSRRKVLFIFSNIWLIQQYKILDYDFPEAKLYTFMINFL